MPAGTDIFVKTSASQAAVACLDWRFCSLTIICNVDDESDWNARNVMLAERHQVD